MRLGRQGSLLVEAVDNSELERMRLVVEEEKAARLEAVRDRDDFKAQLDALKARGFGSAPLKARPDAATTSDGPSDALQLKILAEWLLPKFVPLSAHGQWDGGMR